MNSLLDHLIKFIKSFQRGDLASFADPTAPSDLGSPLTQAEIDFVKKLKKEMEERFNPGT